MIFASFISLSDSYSTKYTHIEYIRSSNWFIKLFGEINQVENYFSEVFMGIK